MTQPRAQAPKPSVLVYRDVSDVATDIRELYRLMQPKAHRIFKTTPKTHEVGEGEIVFYDDESSTRRGYTKLNGTLRYWALT